METAKLYQVGHDGYYCLHFANKTAYSFKRIEEIFSKYGSVVSVQGPPNNETGYRFVRYKTQEEVERAVKDIKQDHPEIRILLCYENYERDNMKKKEQKFGWNDSTDRNKQQNGKEQTSTRGNNFGDNDKSNAPRSNDGERRPYSSASGRYNKNFEGGERKDSYESSGKESRNSKLGDDGNGRRYNNENGLGGPVNDKLSRLMKLQNLRGANANTFKPPPSFPNVISNEKEDYDSTTNVLNRESSNLEEEVMPSLVCNQSQVDAFAYGTATSGMPITTTLMAEEIIVANIHQSLGVHYILHLFKRYQPLCVSDVKMIPKLSLRYCHLYLKSSQDALDIERKYDKFKVLGDSLIVLRPGMLAQEAFIV